MREGQYFNNGSAATGATASQPPDYPTHRAPGIITPFVQVGTYPTRNFATLGPL